jgi:hypothetical protein
MKSIGICILVLIFIPFNSLGQDTGTNPTEKNIFSGNIMGTSSALGISYQRIIANRASIEFGVGLFGVGTGLTIYPAKIQNSKICFYTGLKLNSAVLVDVGGGTVAYIPFGATFISENNIVFGFDVGPARAKWTTSSFGGNTSETSYFYCGFGNLKIGILF